MPKATFLGVFSTRGMLADPGGKNVGGQRKQFWFVWQDTIAKTYLAQQLNASYMPQGEPRLLPPETFRQAFAREPRVRAMPTIQPDVADYLNSVFAREPKQEETLLVTDARSKKHAAPPEEPAARFVPPLPDTEIGRKPRAKQPPASGGVVDPEELDRSLRAEFAMNVMRFRRGNTDGAIQEFRRMVQISDGIMAAHKHMFTDFGVDLRKSKLYELALTCFRRALELSPGDSHAVFNVGRALYELGKYKEACEYLNQALALEPDLACARRLLEQTRVQMDSFIPQEF